MRPVSRVAAIAVIDNVGAAGQPVDVPLGNKDDIRSFDELDTITVCVADSPRPNEILAVTAVSDGGRYRAPSRHGALGHLSTRRPMQRRRWRPWQGSNHVHDAPGTIAETNSIQRH